MCCVWILTGTCYICNYEKMGCHDILAAVRILLAAERLLSRHFGNRRRIVVPQRPSLPFFTADKRSLLSVNCTLLFRWHELLNGSGYLRRKLLNLRQVLLYPTMAAIIVSVTWIMSIKCVQKGRVPFCSWERGIWEE